MSFTKDVEEKAEYKQKHKNFLFPDGTPTQALERIHSFHRLFCNGPRASQNLSRMLHGATGKQRRYSPPHNINDFDTSAWVSFSPADAASANPRCSIRIPPRKPLHTRSRVFFRKTGVQRRADAARPGPTVLRKGDSDIHMQFAQDRKSSPSQQNIYIQLCE